MYKILDLIRSFPASVVRKGSRRASHVPVYLQGKLRTPLLDIPGWSFLLQQMLMACTNQINTDVYLVSSGGRESTMLYAIVVFKLII